MKLQSAFIIALAFFVAPVSSALGAGYVENAVITRVSYDDSGAVFIEATAPHPLPGAPACATDATWQLAFPITSTTGPGRLAAVLSAKLTGKTVRLIGTGSCFPGYAIEWLGIIDIK